MRKCRLLGPVATPIDLPVDFAPAPAKELVDLHWAVARKFVASDHSSL